MKEKKRFNFNIEMQKCLSENMWDTCPEFSTANLYDAVYSIALKMASKPVDLVSLESDYLKYGSTISKALKDADVKVNTLLIEDADFYHMHTKGFFSFSGGQVIVLGSSHLLSLTLYYASRQNVSCHAILTEPNFEMLLSSKIKIVLNGVPVYVDVNPFKTIICDLEVLTKASKESVAESYIRTVSKLLTLTDYKLRVFTDGLKFNKVVYDSVKKAIALALNVNSYENYKEVLIYAQLVMAKAYANSEVLTDGGVELFCDTLGVFAPDFSYRDRLMMAFNKLVKVYHMFFNNDFSNLLSVPNYNADIFILEKTTGKSGGYFRKNLKIPSERRRTLINALIYKTREGFLKETSAMLSVLSPIVKIYEGLNKQNKEKPIINYDMVKNSLTLCSYFSNKTSILTLCRDMGIWRCIQ